MDSCVLSYRLTQSDQIWHDNPSGNRKVWDINVAPWSWAAAGSPPSWCCSVIVGGMLSSDCRSRWWCTAIVEVAYAMTNMVFTCAADKFYEQSFNFTTSTSIVDFYKDVESAFYCSSSRNAFVARIRNGDGKVWFVHRQDCRQIRSTSRETIWRPFHGKLSYRQTWAGVESSWSSRLTLVRGSHLRSRATCCTVRSVNGLVSQATTCHH